MSVRPKKLLIAKCRLCASSCFTVVGRLISNADDIQEYAFQCMLDCQECFEECKKYVAIEDIKYCGQVCLNCSNMLKKLVVVSNPN